MSKDLRHENIRRVALERRRNAEKARQATEKLAALRVALAWRQKIIAGNERRGLSVGC